MSTETAMLEQRSGRRSNCNLIATHDAVIDGVKVRAGVTRCSEDSDLARHACFARIDSPEGKRALHRAAGTPDVYWLTTPPWR